MSITTNFKSGGNDIGTLFCDLTNNQNIDGNKTFSNAITTNNGTIQSSVPRVSIWLGGTSFHIDGSMYSDNGLLLPFTKLTYGYLSNNNSGFDDANNRFNCPLEGYYQIAGNITIIPTDNTNAGSYCWIYTYLNDNIIDMQYLSNCVTGVLSGKVNKVCCCVNNILYLNVNDKIQFKLYTQGTINFYTEKDKVRISIFYLSG
jgi:hypothetical protein